MCIYMYMCIHTCTHTHMKFFFHLGKEGAVWRPECEGEKTPPSVPRVPLQRCRNSCWGASQWPSVSRKWQCGQLHPAGLSTPLDSLGLLCEGQVSSPLTTLCGRPGPWSLWSLWSCLCLGRKARWISWRSTFPVASFLPSMAALLVGRGPSLLQKAELHHCLALFHEANEKILLTYLSSISVPGMRAPKTGIEPWVFWQSYRRCQNYGAETHGAFCALGRGSEQQRAQRLWKEQPWLRSEIQMGYLGLEGSSCLFYEVKILLRYAQTT